MIRTMTWPSGRTRQTPTGNPLTVKLNWHTPNTPLLEFRDMMGRLLYSRILEDGEIQAPFDVDTSRFQSGLYYISVLDSKGAEPILSKKVYIQ